MKYLLALISEEGGMEDASPEEMKAAMDRWDAYSKEVVNNGVFLAGEGLQPSATASTVRIVQGIEPTVTDGPFAETKEQLGGFYLLECKDLDEALEWAREDPLPERLGRGPPSDGLRRRSRPRPRRGRGRRVIGTPSDSLSTACSGMSRAGRSRA